MERDYKKWHQVKSQLEKKKVLPFFHEREIWYCSLGANVGHEQDGKNDMFERPVCILKKFNREIFWTLPLTSSFKKGKYYFSITKKGLPSSVILSQLRLLDAKRLIRKIGMIPQEEFCEMIALVKSFL